MSVVTLKCCAKCKRMLPANRENFTSANNNKEGLYARCKRCKAEQQREYKDRKKARVSLNGHSKAISPISKLAVIKPTLGTPEQCGSCGTTRGNIHVDDDEDTRVTRGYLCSACYRIAINVRREPPRLRNVADYIEKTQQ